MGNVATIKFNASKGKWEAFVNTMRITGSVDLNYVKMVLTNGSCRKAVQQNITGFKVVDEDKFPVVAGGGISAVKSGEIGQVMMVGENAEGDVLVSPADNAALEFDINQRFEFLGSLAQMVINGITTSLIVTGEGGLGKTHTVMQVLKDAGMQDCAQFGLPDVVEGEELVWSNPGDYTVVKGFSTAKAMYRTLFENRDKLVVFDDCDNVLKDKTAILILKAALDSYDKRYVNWGSEGGFDDLPRVFEFTGKVIFISNMQQSAIDQAIKSRALRIDLSMTAVQKLDRMEAILADILPDYKMSVKQDALNFLRKNVDRATDLNLRTLMNVAKIRVSVKNWEDLALYTITA